MVSNSKHGEQSASFGQWLSDTLRDDPSYQHYAVYYDHGDKTTHPNVAAIKGIFGDKVNGITQLTQVDVMVAKPNREIIALVEIEEGQCSPKKIIGDIFTNLMCNRYAVMVDGEQRYFSITSQTVLVLAGIMNPRGKQPEQLQETILPRLRHFDTPEDGVRLDKVWFIFEENIESVINELRIRIGDALKSTW